MRYPALTGLTVLAFVVAAGCVMLFRLGEYVCAIGAAYMPGDQSLIEGCNPFGAALLIGGGVAPIVAIIGVFVGWLMAFFRRGWGFMVFAAAPGYALGIAVLVLVISVPFQVYHDANELIP
ncbi:MAG: hypothetical protein ACFE0P_14305 [Oceanicaulis sp.]